MDNIESIDTFIENIDTFKLRFLNIAIHVYMQDKCNKFAWLYQIKNFANLML